MIEERILALAERRERREADDKRHVFARLQTEDPAVAAFLRDVAKTFGKPATLAIRFRDGTTYRQGHFDEGETNE